MYTSVVTSEEIENIQKRERENFRIEKQLYKNLSVEDFIMMVFFQFLYHTMIV
jgi:hypothetical protein